MSVLLWWVIGGVAMVVAIAVFGIRRKRKALAALMSIVVGGVYGCLMVANTGLPTPLLGGFIAGAIVAWFLFMGIFAITS